MTMPKGWTPNKGVDDAMMYMCIHIHQTRGLYLQDNFNPKREEQGIDYRN